MKFRIVDAALLLATLAGGIMAVSSARRLHALQQEHARLSRAAGDMVITDPALLHVQALDTGEPLHFAWRVYTPVGHVNLSEWTGGRSGGSGGSYNSQPREFIARIRFAEESDDRASLYINFHSGSSYRTLDSTEVHHFLRAHENELNIEQLGAGRTVRLKPGEAATLLRITMPESLAAEARQKLTNPNSPPLIPNVLECRLEFKP